MDTDQTLGVDIEDAAMRSLRRRMMASALQHEPVFRGQPGRQLYRQFLRQGLDDVTAEAVPVYFTDFAVFRRTWLGTPSEEDFAGGVFTREEWAAYERHFEALEREGVRFGYVVMVLAAGRRPA